MLIYHKTANKVVNICYLLQYLTLYGTIVRILYTVCNTLLTLYSNVSLFIHTVRIPSVETLPGQQK